MDRRGGSVTINPANLSTMKIYGQSKRRQDLARLPEGAGAGADQMTLDTGFRAPRPRSTGCAGGTSVGNTGALRRRTPPVGPPSPMT